MTDRLFSNVLQPLAPRIVIDVSPDEFTFQSRRSSTSLETVVWLRDTGASEQPGAMGAPCNRVQLFAGESAFPSDPDFLMDALVKLIRTGMASVLMKRSFLRPVVVLRGVASLNSRLGGFQANLLRAALRRAGALEVEIES